MYLCFVSFYFHYCLAMPLTHSLFFLLYSLKQRQTLQSCCEKQREERSGAVLHASAVASEGGGEEEMVVVVVVALAAKSHTSSSLTFESMRNFKLDK